MTTDDTLSTLVEKNWVAKEVYRLRESQERSPCDNAAMRLARSALTEAAEADWKQAEAALWKHRIAFGLTVPQVCAVRPVRGLFDWLPPMISTARTWAIPSAPMREERW